MNMKRSLRFKVHELTPLKPVGSSGKYIGKNPFTKIKNDLILDDYHDYIIIKSDSFAGTWWEFQKEYSKNLNTLWESAININQPVKFDLKMQRKLYRLDSQITEIVNEIKKFQKDIKLMISIGKRSRLFYDTEYDITIQFFVSKKHSAYNPDDDNIVYEDSFWNKRSIIDRREKYYFGERQMSDKFKKKDWSAITYYFYNNCSYEDIMCIDYLFVEVKPIIQLSRYFNKSC